MRKLLKSDITLPLKLYFKSFYWAPTPSALCQVSYYKMYYNVLESKLDKTHIVCSQASIFGDYFVIQVMLWQQYIYT